MSVSIFKPRGDPKLHPTEAPHTRVWRLEADRSPPPRVVNITHIVPGVWEALKSVVYSNVANHPSIRQEAERAYTKFNRLIKKRTEHILLVFYPYAQLNKVTIRNDS